MYWRYSCFVLYRGVTISGGWQSVLIVGLVFSVANFFLKPLLKLILGPIILLTLGLFIVVINMGCYGSPTFSSRT